MPHHAIKLRKDPQRVNHDDKFAKCWSKLGPERESLPRKGTFLVNCLIFFGLTIVPHHTTFQNFQRMNHGT